MKKIVLIFALILGFCISASAQVDIEGHARLDRTVYDFGEVSVKDGPLSCSFQLTNIGDDQLTIYAVVSSCGCTDVEWTRTALAPGETGTIKATYSNDEGPYAFDKVLTVYISDVRKPIILHIRGDVAKPKKSR